MPEFKYYAKRAIKAGHTSGVEYTIDIGLQSLSGLMPIARAAINTALSGNTVTTIHRVDRIYTAVTQLQDITGGTYDPEDFDEFFSSVAGGEVFVFNDGTDENAILVGNASEKRVEGLYFTYQFRFRLL